SQPYVGQNMYVEIGTGYTYTNWSKMAASGLGVYQTVTQNRHGGVIVGAIIGYQYWHYLMTEFGYLYLPLSKGTSTAGNIQARNWLAYFAAKLMVPLFRQLSFTAKLGIGYHQLRYSDTGAAIFSEYARIWTPIFGAGLQYQLPKNIYLAVEWLRVPQYTNSGRQSHRLPSSDLFMASAGYRFIF
ncbi:MAG: outer membrane beta-barrel protein, partial [Gammaproteobacteria bacterium]|nr:outer membrane beta-barrel protein [Gammaproteobacteria bacterium]